MLPGDEITQREAARILSTSPSIVQLLIRRGELTRSADHQHRQRSAPRSSGWRWHAGRLGWLADPTPKWVTTDQAAELLGVTSTRVRQLGSAGRLPFETTPKGRRLYRRQQVEVIANALRARFGA